MTTRGGKVMKLFDFGPPVVPPSTEDGLTFRDAYYFKPANIVLAALGHGQGFKHHLEGPLWDLRKTIAQHGSPQ